MGVRLIQHGSRRWYLLITVSIFLFLLSIQPQGAGAAAEPIIERYMVDGSLIHNGTHEPLFNFTVKVDKEDFIEQSVRTDINGTYSFILPPGNYTITVCTPKGINLAWKEITVGPHQTNHWDFELDPKNPVRSMIFGRIVDDRGDPLADAIISLTQTEPFWTNRTVTDKGGWFSLTVPSGTYRFEVQYNNKQRVNRTITLEWSESVEENIEIDLSNERPILTLEDIRDFLTSHWKDLLILFGLTLMILVLYSIFLRVLGALNRKKYAFLQSEWFIPLRRFIGRISILAIVLIIAGQISHFSPFVEDYIWSWMPKVGGALAGILVILLLLRILLYLNDKLWEFVKNRGGRGKGMILPAQLISLLEIMTRYFIFTLAGLLIIILVLSAFGLTRNILDRGGNFLSDNAGKIMFLLVLIIAGFILKKFTDIFFFEIRNRASKLSPQVIEMSRKGTTGVIYFIIALIFMFTLLSIGGLGEIGQTFILVISMIIGMVVSFAATGSIGNMLSGLVLVTMKPFDVGDRVEVTNGVIGNVENIGLMFTRIRDIENRINEIPNNNILSGRIVNYSRSAEKDCFSVVVDVSLGYDIHPKKARALMKRAALTSPGVLKEPSPQVMVRTFLDHAVEYRLRSYTKDAKNMLFIRSSIMESMLVIFHQEGLEILSPLFHVKREGKFPTRDELGMRSEPPSDSNNEDASGLTMFDDIDSSG